MNALSVVSLDDAKDYLRISDGCDDELITSLIGAAVDWVERYTSHYLYARDVEVTTTCHSYETAAYPVNSITTTSTYTERKLSLKTEIYAPIGSELTLNIGYQDRIYIPRPFLTAVKKLVTYWYENRDMYDVQMPTDVQMLINQYRRGII